MPASQLWPLGLPSLVLGRETGLGTGEKAVHGPVGVRLHSSGAGTSGWLSPLAKEESSEWIAQHREPEGPHGAG